eukprot:gene5564-biopygen8327
MPQYVPSVQNPPPSSFMFPGKTAASRDAHRDATRLAFLPPANKTRMIAMRRGSIFVPGGTHPRWVRCDATRCPAAQMKSYTILKKYLRLPEYFFPGHGVVVAMRHGPHTAQSEEDERWLRCDAGLTRHSWRRTRRGFDATRGFVCVLRG